MYNLLAVNNNLSIINTPRISSFVNSNVLINNPVLKFHTLKRPSDPPVTRCLQYVKLHKIYPVCPSFNVL